MITDIELNEQQLNSLENQLFRLLFEGSTAYCGLDVTCVSKYDNDYRVYYIVEHCDGPKISIRKSYVFVKFRLLENKIEDLRISDE